LDILIGTGGMPAQTGFKGGFWLLKNNGTNAAPAYAVESENYLNLASTFSVYNIKPQWADFDGDGVADLGFAATSTTTLKLEYRYIPNKAQAGAAAQLNLADAVTVTLPNESQTGDSPYFYDTDGDGDLDMLVGKSQGNIYYYSNTGTNKQFAFKLESDAFAGVTISFEGRSPQLAVADFDLDGRPDLITADHTGNIRIFHGAAWGQWTEREKMLVELNGQAAAPSFGNYLSLAVGDYNGDKKPDVAIGNNAGGLRLLNNILPVTITGVEPVAGPLVNVYPNPAAKFLKITSSKPATFDVLTVSGKKVLHDQKLNSNIEKELSTEHWPAGLYLIEFKTGSSRTVRKVMVAN